MYAGHANCLRLVRVERIPQPAVWYALLLYPSLTRHRHGKPRMLRWLWVYPLLPTSSVSVQTPPVACGDGYGLHDSVFKVQKPDLRSVEVNRGEVIKPLILRS
jgi:hypothetical protein